MKTISVSREELAILKDLFRGDWKILLFGSRIKGTNKPFSDLDVCLKSIGTPGQTIDCLKLADLRESLTKSNLPYRVDIVDYYEIKGEKTSLTTSSDLSCYCLCY